MQIHKSLISPILDRLDSETWHVNAVDALHVVESNPLMLKSLELFVNGGRRLVDKRLNVTLAGIKLENPLMLGAGWDKNGKAVRASFALGFSGVEVGGVLVHPQKGNPKPRQFVIGNGVVLNRLGFNSVGVDQVEKNLQRYKNDNIPIGINIGKNRDVLDQDAPEAYATVIDKLYNIVSFFVINVSSPNTPGFRKLQQKNYLKDIVKAANSIVKKRGGIRPLFVKIAPDLKDQEVDDIIEVVLDNNLSGIVATNTTIRVDLKAKYGKKWAQEAGGLSGDDEDFRKMSNEKIAYIHKQTKGKIDIIGIGGVKDAPTALEKIKAGAKAVQLVTALRGEGLSIAHNINSGILNWMKKEGLKSINELVGVDYKRYI